MKEQTVTDMMAELAALDAEIESKVFGGDIIQSPRTLIWGHRWDGTEDVIDTKAIPCYSTDLEAAMTLLDTWHGDWEIRRQNGHYKVTLYEPSMQGDEWDASLPLAICRIRLRALGWPLSPAG